MAEYILGLDLLYELKPRQISWQYRARGPHLPGYPAGEVLLIEVFLLMVRICCSKDLQCCLQGYLRHSSSLLVADVPKVASGRILLAP